jgi:hypothetical protein
MSRTAAQTRTLTLDVALYDRLAALATKHACTIPSLIVEAIELGEMFADAERIEFLHPEHTGGTVRVIAAWSHAGGL